MRNSVPIHAVVHYPTTEESRKELARRVASVQADFVMDAIRKLNGSAAQKLTLPDAVIATARQKATPDKYGTVRPEI